MESFSDIVILALVQGLAEFLPISSSGHLVLAQHLLGLTEPRLLLDILLHVGTLIAVLLFLKSILVPIVTDTYAFIVKKKAMSMYVKIVLFAMIGCVPAFIAVFFFKDFFVSFFMSPLKISILLIVNGLILLFARFVKVPQRVSLENLSMRHALIIGCAQCLAILPGISRSGTTITCALLLGIEPVLAFQFSFLLSIPAILGAVVMEGEQVLSMEMSHIQLYGIGLVLACASGFSALFILKRFVVQNKLHVFSIYCISVGFFFALYFGLQK